MGKFRKNWTILLFLLFGIRLVNAQTEVTIGSGTELGPAPVFATAPSSYIQSLYLSTELQAGLITSVSFNYGLTDPMTVAPSTIYMGEVDRTAFYDDEDRVPADSLTQMFSGSVTFSQGWVTITFDQPFIYSGTGNLVVAYLNNTADYLSDLEGYFYSSNTADYKTNVYFSNWGTININNLNRWGSQLSLNQRPNIKLSIASLEGFCFAPSNVNVSSITGESAVVSWNAPEGQTTFGVAYKEASAETWVTLPNVTGTTTTLTDLEGLTNYSVKVWTICGEESLSTEVVRTFTTDVSSSQIATLPYNETFDSQESVSSWLLENGNNVNKWYWGTVENNTTELPTSGALFISSNDGLGNVYNNEEESEVFAKKYIQFPEALNFKLAFDVKCLGEVDSDELYVHLVANGQSVNYSNLIGAYSGISSWERKEILLPASYANQTMQLVFRWSNDFLGGTNLPAAVDNISLTAMTCGMVNNLAVAFDENEEGVIAEVSFSNANPAVDSYIVEYALNGTDNWTSLTFDTTIAEITGLPYATSYSVRVKVHCADDSMSEYSETISFTTPCGMITSFPWTEGFENPFVTPEGLGNAEAPLCWVQFTRDDYYMWDRNTVYPSSGSGCLRGLNTAYSSDANAWMISPAMQFTGGEMLVFKMRRQYESHIAKLKVYTLSETEQPLSSISDTSRFQLVRSIELSGPGADYTTYEVGLSSLQGQGRFAFVFSESANTFYIDDVSVEVLPDCPNVYGVTAQRVGTNSASVNFDTSNGNNSGWVIAYGQANSETEFNPETVPANQQISITSADQLPYVIEGLTSGAYYFAVKQDCDGAYSPAVSVFIPVVNNIPYTQNFDSNVAGEWDLGLYSGTNKWVIGTATSNSEASGSSMYISDNNGDSNTYSFTSQSRSYAVTYISFGQAPKFTLTYDWKAMGQTMGISAYDYGKVYLLPDSMNITTSQTINNSYAISGDLVNQNTWQSDTIEIDATYANSVRKLVFAWYNNSSTGTNPALAIDNISLVEGNCGQVVDLNVEYAQGAEGIDATVSFVDYSQNASYVIEYKSEFDADWTVMTSTTQSQVITGLDFNTEYSFRVAVVCQDGSQTDYTEVTAQTPCGAISQLPWGESFNIAPDECWTLRKGALTDTVYTNDLQIPTSHESPWAFNATNAVGGVSNGRMQAYVYGTTAKFWLITPTINIPNEGVYELSLDVLARKTMDDLAPAPAPDDKFVVLVSTDNGNSWTTSNAIIYTDSDADTTRDFSDFNQTPTRVKFKLENAEGVPYSGFVKFAFYVESTQSNGSNYVFIDNIAVNQWSDCESPFNLSVSNITNNTVDLTFPENEGMEGWEYIVVPQGGSIEAATLVEVAESPVTIDNLESEMNYTVHLRAICSETSVSPWSVGVSFTTTPDPTPIPYTCDFNFEQGQATGWLLKNGNCANKWVVSNPASLTSGALFVSDDNGVSTNYGSGISVIVAEKVFSFGESDSIAISFDLTVGGEVIGNEVYDYLKVYLVPENTSFEPSLEYPLPSYATANYSQGVILTNAEGGYYVANQTATINIEMPTPQQTSKIVFVWVNDESMGVQPGAIIDNFSITEINPVIPCVAPANLAVESVDQSTFNLSWVAAGSETQWEVRLDEAESVIVETVTYQFTNVALGTHTAYVRAICGEGNYSEWASLEFENTLVLPQLTTEDATNITANSATLKAVLVSGSETITSVGFKYKVANQEEWTIANYVGENYEEIAVEVTELASATEYEFKSFVVCGENEYEGEVKTFSTLASLQEELSNMLSVSLYPNPAKESATLEFLGLNSEAKISIVNMKGQIVKTIDIQPSQSYELNLTDFASGVYYVKVITEGKIITQKLIVE
ncbi:MAG: fibronectin type III domain-containing protein [Bacteroidales bacterium]|nr:fibronectin type III domain-containing protein [Bacteroidales bacterium]